MKKMIGGLRVAGSRATEKVVLPAEVRSCKTFATRIAARLMSREDFIENHASGTLRKNARIGMESHSQYLSERVAYEFGYGFESVHETHVTWGTPITFGDEHSITEAGWHIERYAHVCLFPGDEIEAKYIQVEYPDGKRREGLGMVVRSTSAQFVPSGHMVFAIIAEWDALRKEFKPAINPC